MNFNQREQACFETLGAEPKHVDDIIAETNLKPEQVLASLIMLEVRHKVRQWPGKRFTNATLDKIGAKP